MVIIVMSPRIFFIFSIYVDFDDDNICSTR